jgi:arginine/lysine/ornithine decarboxylase
MFYDMLKKYRKMGRSSFHTPGHKCEMFKSRDLLSLDFTELPLTDSLYEASGIINRAENFLQKLYGSKKSLFSLGGNTLCIQTMLRLCAPTGGKILCDRVVHRSAVSAMALLGIQPTWVRREFNEESGLPESVNMLEVGKNLSENPDFKALYVTSPSYHGILQDVKSLSDKCGEFNVPVLVDNAHGSHLGFAQKNLHPLDQGASLVADSAHKTLPVLTGGAWLHINNEKFIDGAKNAMAVFGSTSPSYVTMASMNMCCEWLSKNGEKEFARLKTRVDSIKKIARSKGMFVPNDGSCDPVRITLGVWKIGKTGYEFRQHLYKFKIEPEFCDENYVVLIPSPFNTKTDWRRLKSALLAAEPGTEKTTNFKNYADYKLPVAKTSLREALMSPGVCVDVNDSKNKIAAEVVCPCPPGVPVVMPGEQIGSFELYALKSYGISKILVLK